ncbi:MAG TPA: winged helix DNA-binding domain-containing protein [Miltoncostaeaceae bacterium]|nr:winged helix DNA-binding domain-containing protein [Miltoncostaeaceae bacterium]
MRRLDVEERRARLGIRHRLARNPADGPVEVARDLVALHATDPATVHLSAAARMREPDVAAVERALYEDRSLIRMLGMRRTMFVIPDELAPAIQAACTGAIAARERARLVKRLQDAGVAEDAGAWLAEVEEATLAALRARGEAAAAELSADEPRLRTSVLMAVGKPYAARQNVSTWVLGQLSMDGRVVRGRPRGSWISSQYRWSPVERWLPGGMPERDAAHAGAELVRRYLAAFGPVAVADIRWWTGWTARQVAAALARLETAEVDLGGGAAGVLLAEDLEPVAAPEPWVALLPALDPTPMGWLERSWFLGDHGPPLFDRSGNIGPSVWADGRIVGGWAQRRDGEVAVRLLEDVEAGARATIGAAAERLAAWLGDVRLMPRFRTPLERELSG